MRWTRFYSRSRRDDETAREIASYLTIETDDNIARASVDPMNVLRQEESSFGSKRSKRSNPWNRIRIRP